MTMLYATTRPASSARDHAAPEGSRVAICGTEVASPSVAGGIIIARPFDPTSYRACQRCAKKASNP